MIGGCSSGSRTLEEVSNLYQVYNICLLLRDPKEEQAKDMTSCQHIVPLYSVQIAEFVIVL